MLQVSDFDKTSKPENQPWKVMLDGTEDNDKWMTTQTKGAWVVYFFGKPVVMKGYGLRCCKQSLKEMNPLSFSLWIKDAVQKTSIDGSDDNEWIEVHNTKNAMFSSGHKVNEYAFNGGVRIVTAIRLSIKDNDKSAEGTHLN
jgi:hypothetical protein